MAPARVDYDRIAATYDGRYGFDRMEAVTGLLREVAREARADRILEVGCGTGHFLSDLQAVAPRRYGVDLSSAMLEKAAVKGPLLLYTTSTSTSKDRTRPTSAASRPGERSWTG